MNDRYTGFPKDYEYLEPIFEPLTKSIDAIDYAIEKMPPEGGPQPPQPAGGPPPIPRAVRIANLYKQKDAIQASMYNTAKDAVVNADPATVKEVLDKTQMMANPAIYKQSKQGFDEMLKDKADINHSQERASRVANDYKYSTHPKEPNKEERGSFENNIERFFDDIAPESDRKVSKEEPEKTKEDKGNKNIDPTEAFEKSMANFFNETAIDYSDNREDITKEPSIEPAIGPDDNR